MWITSSLASVLTPTAVALGNFDGIHNGHRQVIQPVLAPELPPESPPNRQRTIPDRALPSAIPTVVTFTPHPREFFSGQPRQLLTPVAEKVQQLQAMGIKQLVRLPFNRELADLSPEAFVEKILVQRLQVKQLSVGADFCFGRSRSGTAAQLQTLATAYGVQVVIVPLKLRDGDRISSSAIRAALQQGDVPLANQLLGRAYPLVGPVVLGQQLGRTLGFPTANLHLPPEKFLPRFGVYAVRVQIGTPDPVAPDPAAPDPAAANLALAPTFDPPPRLIPGVLNLGLRPTVDGQTQTTEVHLFDWSGDLYGQTLIVHLHQFIRPEQKFDSLDALKQQIQTDCQTARALLAIAP